MAFTVFASGLSCWSVMALTSTIHSAWPPWSPSTKTATPPHGKPLPTPPQQLIPGTAAPVGCHGRRWCYHRMPPLQIRQNQRTQTPRRDPHQQSCAWLAGFFMPTVPAQRAVTQSAANAAARRPLLSGRPSLSESLARGAAGPLHPGRRAATMHALHRLTANQ